MYSTKKKAITIFVLHKCSGPKKVKKFGSNSKLKINYAKLLKYAIFSFKRFLILPN